MRLALDEISYSIFAFPTLSAVTITVYNVGASSWEVLDDDAAVEVLDPVLVGTGYFKWSIANLHTAPVVDTEYLVFATDTLTVQVTKIKYGGYVEHVEQIKTQMDNLILSSEGAINIETPWVVGELPTGVAVTIKLYDSTGALEPLDDDTCTEIGVTGFYFWSTHNMTTYPATASSFLWVMESTGRRDSGIAIIGTPENMADTVWNALLADHSEPDSAGEALDLINAAVQRVEGLIEDDGLGNDRFTAKALEEAPSGGGTPPTVEEIRQEIDANSTMLADIYTDTQRVDGLIENSSGDRFTAKALEEAPTGGGSAFLDEDTTAHTVLGSFGFALGSLFGTPVVVESKTSQYKLEITLDKRITELINDAPVTGDVYTFIYLDKDGYNHQGSINLDDIATGVVAVQGENRTKTPYTLIFTIHNAGNTDSWSRTIAQITIL